MRPLLGLAVVSLLLQACSGDPSGPDARTIGGADATIASTDAQIRDAGPGIDAAGVAQDTGLPPGADAAAAGPDAGIAGRDASLDRGDTGPITSCSDLPAKGCLSNEACAASEYCKSFSTTLEFRCCVDGARGTGVAGGTCATDADCAFGRCLERDDHKWFCSGACQTDLDCPGIMFCSAVMKWCVPRDAGAPPKDCAQVSKTQCYYNDNCATAERCQNLGTAALEVFCCTTGARGTKTVGTACTSELDCTFGRCLGGLCSEACDIGDDPCPPATMVCNDIRGMCEPK